MKVEMECLICLLERGVRAVERLSPENPDKHLEVSKKILRLLLKEFNLNQVPAWIGTKREKIIQRVLNNKDPYRELKRKSNEIAKQLWEELKSNIDLSNRDFNTFRKMMLNAAAANAVEWFIRGHDFSLDAFKREFQNIEERVAIDETKELWKDIREAKSLLYVLDNSGEAVIDLHVVRYLSNFVDEIYVGARERPIINDITVDEAYELGFGDIAKEIVPVGWFIGIFLDREGVTANFLRIFKRVDVVIAKGMGAYESLSEYTFDKPVYIVLKAKCAPVARHLNVPHGWYVIKRM